MRYAGYKTWGHRLPSVFSVPLFGDRKKYGKTPDYTDICWKEWKEIQSRFYENMGEGSRVGKLIDHAGYKVVERIDFGGKNVLEIGPGQISHLKYWKSEPENFTLLDIDVQMLERGVRSLEEKGIKCEKVLLPALSNGRLPFEDKTFDIILSFYSLEHLHPLQLYLDEIKRVLKVGGKLAGAIPAEGGLAWGAGRMLTTRRWMKNNTNINYDKLICWEHPNFADQILNDCHGLFDLEYCDFWPLKLSILDINLICKFIYERKSD